MQYLTSFLFAALASLAAAQNPNPFTFSSLTTITAGQPFTITWTPTTGSTDTISLILRQGDSAHLSTVETIVSHIANSGSYAWIPPTSLVNGDNYAFEIVDDANTDLSNYSGQFSISSPTTVSGSSSGITSTASSGTSSTRSASTTGSSSTGSSSSGSTSTTSSGSSATTLTSTGRSNSTATTGSSSSDTAKTTSTKSGSASTTGTSASATVSSLNSGSSFKVGSGMLAVVGAVMVAL